MNCWITLGIEEYSDKKTIKVAYAKLLKLTKPDDDPQGFKELHSAYKEALDLVSEYKESSSPQWFTPPEKDKKSISFDEDFSQQKPDIEEAHIEDNANDVSNESEQPYVTPVVEAHTTQAGIDSNQILEELEEAYGTPKQEVTPDIKPEPNHSNDSDDYSNSDNQEYLDIEPFGGAEAQAELEKDWHYLESQTKFIIKTKAVNSVVADWKFLESIPSMIDLDFRSQASDLVFEIVSEINQISLEKKTLLVKTPILNYLNSLFMWDKKWKHYEETYGYQADAVFPYLTEADSQNTEPTKKLNRDLHYYTRGAAYVVDMGLVYIFYVVQKYVLELSEENNFAIVAVISVIYVFIAVPLLEASSAQASLGKMLFGLKVVNDAGLRIPWYQSFWRSIATGFCIGFFKIVLFINFYLAYKKGALLQDIVSKSYVIKGRK